jgi:hypothetical protein
MDLHKTYALTDAMETNINDQVALQTKLVAARAWQCCTNCVHLNRETQACARYIAVPPPTVAINGCADWDGLPF